MIQFKKSPLHALSQCIFCASLNLANFAVWGSSLLIGADAALADPQSDAKLMFRRLTGAALHPSDPRLSQMASEIAAGKPMSAARIATNDSLFYNIVLRQWAAPLSNKEHLPDAPLDDMQATVIGIVRDELDARSMLTGDFYYRAKASYNMPAVSPRDNQHYSKLEADKISLKDALEQAPGRQTGVTGRTGVLTSRGFSNAYLKAGTNRLGLVQSMTNFLCSPVETWKDPTLPDDFVRRDVLRDPAGPELYQKECRGCHSAMDGLGGAFARHDFVADQLVQYDIFTVAPKYNQNINNYPAGYRTEDDFWVNYLSRPQHQYFGWRSPMQGYGLEAFAQLLAESEAFSQCMVEKATRAVCRREPSSAQRMKFKAIAQDFEKDNYNLRKLFESLAVGDICKS